MKTFVTLLLSIVLLAVSSHVFSAKKVMYKWTDDKGEIHYSERAPKGYEYKKITTYVNENAVTKVAPEAIPANKPDISGKYNNWKDENCTIATQNLDMLKNTARIGVDDGDGGKRLMTDEEKQVKMDKMTEQQTKYCKKEE
ncbi:MAG: hypothetical protein COA86_06015 [Kangiella sp.]|nr:MAG: hypothetical protein COA86_06015 [Kangiella sp.]